jgi:hypothetical protein
MKRLNAAHGLAESGDHQSTRAVLTSLAAVGGILAASSCCWPILPFVAAAGFAGSSALLSTARPYLSGVSILLIAYGFYQARRAKTCGRRPRVLTSMLLWISTAFVVVTIFFPQIMANAVANLLAR